MTVCDSAAGESCPVFADDALRVHWGIPIRLPRQTPESFAAAFDTLDRRIARLVALPFAELDETARREALQTVADTEPYRA